MRGATVVVNSFHSREQGEQTGAEIRDQGGTAVHVWGRWRTLITSKTYSRKSSSNKGWISSYAMLLTADRFFLELTPDDWTGHFVPTCRGTTNAPSGRPTDASPRRWIDCDHVRRGRAPLHQRVG